MRYFCCSSLRRGDVINSALNGIDFLEVLDQDAPIASDRQRVLFVHFLKNVDPTLASTDHIRIEGGDRVKNIEVQSVAVGADANVLRVEVDRPGDFSIYTLRVVRDANSDEPPVGIDIRLACVDFSFKVECPTDFDCAPRQACPQPSDLIPDIDYLAKDYASFRRLMLDRMSALAPTWKERNPVDLGVMLVEALAYVADQFSYQQDAIATEAYLGTARRRISVRRHARLMDYFISDGCNARTWVHLQVGADVLPLGPTGPVLPAGTKLFTRITDLGTVIADDPAVYRPAKSAFQTIEPVDALYVEHNEIKFYTWSEQRCCLPKGATAATLMDHYAHLKAGDILIFEEVLGPKTGVGADADPAKRHAVRLSQVVATAPGNTDLTDLVTGQPVTNIQWSQEDALPFALCISAQTEVGYKPNVSIARGNIVLADHGLTIEDEPLGSVPEPFLFQSPKTEQGHCESQPRKPIPPRYRPQLANGPLTHAGPSYNHTQAARLAMRYDQQEVKPSIGLQGTLGADTSSWEPRFDLLESHENDQEFVVEIENDGVAQLRFGDDHRGKRPEPGTSFTATYRVGNGKAGNIGADTLVHIATAVTSIVGVRNPLPAQGGRDPESIEDLRQRVPIAYRTLGRAVTPNDYSEITQRLTEVQRAETTFRWTGSWHTVFITVDRQNGLEVTDEFEQAVRDHVEEFRMAGYDLEVDGPQFVALEIEMDICVDPQYFRSEVKQALLDVLSNQMLPDGRLGVFHPDNFTFGQPVYLSPIYAAVQSVPGVSSVHIKTFRRLGDTDPHPPAEGYLPIGRLEIARLDNDPNFAERGVLRINLGGGK